MHTPVYTVLIALLSLCVVRVYSKQLEGPKAPLTKGDTYPVRPYIQTLTPRDERAMKALRARAGGALPWNDPRYYSRARITPPLYFAKEPYIKIAKAFMPINTTVEYPANFTDTFRGSWTNMNITGGNRTAGMHQRHGVMACQLWAFPSKPFQAPVPSKKNDGPNIGFSDRHNYNTVSNRMRKTSSDGFGGSNTRSRGKKRVPMTTVPGAGYDYVLGDMIVQDGEYTGVSDIHLAVEGVYNRSTGQLFMVGHPYGRPSRLENFLTRTNSSLDDWVRRVRRAEKEHKAKYRSLRTRLRRAYEYEVQRMSSASSMSEYLAGTRNWCQFMFFGKASPHVIVAQGDIDTAGSEMSELVDVPTVETFDASSSFDGYLYSPKCETMLRVETSVKELKEHTAKVTRYVEMVVVISVIQMILLIRQMRHAHTVRGALKVSILTLGQQAILDAYLCLFHVYNGILHAFTLNIFLTATFFKFLLFVVFELPYVLTLWKSRQPGAGDPGWRGENEGLQSLLIFARIYLILITGFFLIIYLRHIFPWVLWFLYLYWVPQIILNVIQDSRQQMDPYYIVGMTLTRLAIPLYFFGCKTNYISQPPNYQLCFWLTVTALVQMSVLLYQRQYGSRALIPKALLPEKYDYFRTLENRPEEEQDCVICMMGLDGTAQEMVTPCDHVFHGDCLERWMEIKMECPTCRQDLPPI